MDALVQKLKASYRTYAPDILVALSPLPTEQISSDPQELKAVARAVDKRRREFLAGRALAHALLLQLNVPYAPLEPRSSHGIDRSPNWPSGIIGTISHTHDLCGVALARQSPDVLALGLDIENDAPLGEHLHKAILRPEEHKVHLAKLIFSAKESLYKAQFNLTHTFLDFQDVTLEIDEEAQRFRGHIHHEVGRALGVLEGFFFFEPPWVITGMVIAKS